MDFLEKLSDNLRHCLEQAKKFALKKNRSVIELNDFIIALFHEPNTLANKFFLQDKNNDEKKLADLLSLNLPSIESKSRIKTIEDLLISAFNLAFSQKHTFVGTEHCLAVLLDDPPYLIKYILQNYKINLEKLKNDLDNLLKGDTHLTQINNPENLILQGQDPFTNKPGSGTLKYFSVDLTDIEYQKSINPIIKRDQELDRLIQILCRKDKNNPLILGDPGVGKTALVEGLAKKIVNGEVPNILKNKKIISLDLGSLVAGTMYRGDFENRLKEIIDEIKNDPQTILFIDELHNIVGAGSSNGSLDAANLLKPLLARGQLRCIGATTMEEYKKFIEKDAALERRFQPIILTEPTITETKEILFGVKSNYENYHQVKFDDAAIITALNLSKRYIQDKLFPDKAIDLLDEAAAKQKIQMNNNKLFTNINNLELEINKLNTEKEKAVLNENFNLAIKIKAEQIILKKRLTKLQKTRDLQLTKNPPIVDAQTIQEIISAKTQIPISELLGNDWQTLDKIKIKLQNEIFGQDKALTTIINSLKKSKLGLQDENRPQASFLFLGPSGVGKTYTAKILAEKLFRDQESFIRIDMAEFSEKFNASKLIGAPAGYVGYREENKLTDAIKKRPYSLILFDEIDKAHPEVLNLLLQILEDGYLTDATGKKINFRNTIIIMTANLGADLFNKNISWGFGNQQTNSALIEKIVEEAKKHFRPEFINRLDKIIVFENLEAITLQKIFKKHLKQLEEKKSLINITKLSKNLSRLAQESQKIGQGARTVRQIIDREVENLIIELNKRSKNKIKS